MTNGYYVLQIRKQILALVERSGMAVLHYQSTSQAFPDTDDVTRVALAFGGHRDPTTPEKQIHEFCRVNGLEANFDPRNRSMRFRKARK